MNIRCAATLVKELLIELPHKNVNLVIEQLRYDQFKVSFSNGHPNLVCYKLKNVNNKI